MSESQLSVGTPEDPGDRWDFIRDVLVFQLKLGLDALRDLALVPASLAAALVDLLTGGGSPGRLFYRVFDLGRRADIWIDLFDTYQEGGGADAGSPQRTVDSWVVQLEDLIVEEYRRGSVTASAKDAIDRSLDTISGRGRR